ncbi:unnamed protein product [Schistosoma margrebowiei]|uniref:Uncharacterized protein n=1 Tax=Schistosoma margrebowiei TaxID=48269 RepID=A0A183N0W2_9TREM|nr:unnamed protein product [Schistosoma margrebowiei]
MESFGTSFLVAVNRDNSLAWFQDMLPREITFELFAREEVGSPVFRSSVTHPVCCALSVSVPTNDNPLEITHYSIQKLSRGVQFKGLNKEWPSLQALVTHMTSIRDMLPCPLKLPQYTTNPIFTQFDLQLMGDSSNEIPKRQRKVGQDNRATRSELSSHHLQLILHSVSDLLCRTVLRTCHYFPIKPCQFLKIETYHPIT